MCGRVRVIKIVCAGEFAAGDAAAVPAQAETSGGPRLPQRGGRRQSPAHRPLRLPGNCCRLLRYFATYTVSVVLDYYLFPNYPAR